MVIKAPHVVRREIRAGIAQKDDAVRQKYWYRITSSNVMPDKKGEFAGSKVFIKSGGQCVYLTPAQAQYYLDQRVLERMLPSEQLERRAPGGAGSVPAKPAQPAPRATSGISVVPMKKNASARPGVRAIPVPGRR